MGNYEIGRHIKTLREQRGMTQDELAQAIDVSRQRYNRIENGRVDISYTILEAIAEALNTGIESFVQSNRPQKGLTVLYREKTDDEEEPKGVETIERLLKTLFAHEKLYFETHEDDHDDV